MDTHAVAGNAAIDTLRNGWSGDDGGWDVVPADPWEVYTSVERASGLTCKPFRERSSCTTSRRETPYVIRTLRF